MSGQMGIITKRERMRSQQRVGWLAAWVMVAALSACQAPASTDKAAANDAPNAEPADKSKGDKATGAQSEAPQGAKADAEPANTPKAMRIVSMAPSLTELAFDMGLGDRVVGVSDFATWPPEELADKKRVGGLVNPNLEVIVSLRPDLLLTVPSNTAVHKLAERQKIKALIQPTDTLQQVFEGYEAIAKAAGEPQLGAKHSKALRQKLDAQKVTPENKEGRPKVLLVIGRKPGTLEGIYAAGPGSFLDELTQLVGGRNALPGGDNKWPSISKEYLLANPPDIIIEFDARKDAKPDPEHKEVRQVWSKMKTLEAVKKGRIYRLAGDHLLLPGPRVEQTAKDLRGAIWPK